MRSMLLPILSLLWITVSGQITVNSSIIPNTGDTIRTAIDTNALVVMQGNGGPKTWAFGQLTSHRSSTLVFKAASTGTAVASFPGADLITLGQNNAETYYDRTNNILQILGYAGPDPAGFGLPVIARFNPPLILYRAPINFIDSKQSTSNLTIAFALNDLPDSLFSIPIPGVDSIRIRFTTNILDVCDAYGKMTIPGQTEDVLREKRTETTETALDVRTFLGWTPLPTGTLGGGFLGKDTTVSYRFFANNVKGALADVTLGGDFLTPVQVDFKRNSTVSTHEVTFEEDEAPSATITAYPNPAIDEVNFECRNLPAGTYTIKIYNLLGKSVWAKEYQISGSKSIKVDLENVRRGTYLYTLSDSKGTVIGTKRLVVIKP